MHVSWIENSKLSTGLTECVQECEWLIVCAPAMNRPQSVTPPCVTPDSWQQTPKRQWLLKMDAWIIAVRWWMCWVFAEHQILLQQLVGESHQIRKELKGHWFQRPEWEGTLGLPDVSDSLLSTVPPTKTILLRFVCKCKYPILSTFGFFFFPPCPDTLWSNDLLRRKKQLHSNTSTILVECGWGPMMHLWFKLFFY